MSKRKTPSPSRRSKKTPERRFRLWRALFWLAFIGLLIGGGWGLWVDFQVRRDFEALQWALPARLYSRPMELYAGAHISQANLTTYLDTLGYRRTGAVSGPGEYQVTGATVTLQSRGFLFWDGSEASRQIELDFRGNFISALRESDSTSSARLRLEPVEIAQINPATGEDRLPLPLAEFPDTLVKAIIAVEDQRFYQHVGLDPKGILRALWANVMAGEVVQGGSTLTQQLIKNLYLGQQRTLRRKIEEAMMALALELHFSKEQILNAYLNEIYLGQEGNRAIHGFALAAQYYFGRPVNELTLAEQALLAGLPRGASYYNPVRNPERAVERRNIVLARMLDQGYIAQREFEAASKATLQTRTNAVNRNAYPVFLSLVSEHLARDYDQEALRSEGLRIFTTLDMTAQQVVDTRLDAAVKAVERTGAGKTPLEAAVVITDANTGEVRAIAGSRKPGYTGFNRALNAVRPIGSLVKPAVYLAALEHSDFHLASVLSDRPVSLPQPNGDVWAPRNYDLTSEGDVYLIDALQRSLNLATVDLGMRVGLDKVISTLQHLGVEKAIDAYPSLLLGTLELSPLQVAQMYQSLASGGFKAPLRAVQSVTTADGTPLEWYGLQSNLAADPTAVFLLEHALQGVFTNGTARYSAPQLSTNLPLAGKTGTTDDLRDSWFAGYGSDLIGVVWLGYDDNRATELTGATGALQVWTTLMAQLDILPRPNDQPLDIRWEQVAANATSNAADRDCSTTRLLPFRTDKQLDVAWSCEVNESFFERVLNRIRN